MRELGMFVFALFLWFANSNPDGAISLLSGIALLIGMLLSSPLAGVFAGIIFIVPAFWFGTVVKAEAIISAEQANLEKKAEHWRKL